MNRDFYYGRFTRINCENHNENVQAIRKTFLSCSELSGQGQSCWKYTRRDLEGAPEVRPDLGCWWGLHV